MSAVASGVPQDADRDPRLYNEDLKPTPKGERTWTWFNYSTVWMGMVHNIVAYTMRRSSYDLRSFYARAGDYAYTAGWNVRGLLALAIGMFAALAGNIIPAVGGLANYGWFVGLGVGGVAYYLAMLPDASVASARETAQRRGDEAVRGQIEFT